ncbi:MAG TPA: 16S rRNA (guanine(527)-N(7))-methyltransferase RsmG, partial [Candidatus Binatia bacterium]|nr:16S rRNA (guanine(527)-N(7))-methyltransferase RsmG [Candidatus Binatia bacterium]
AYFYLCSRIDFRWSTRDYRIFDPRSCGPFCCGFRGGISVSRTIASCASCRSFAKAGPLIRFVKIMNSLYATLSDVRMQSVLRLYGVETDSELCEKIRIYVSTLLQWNAKISLTTITDPEQILRVHFGESFFAANVSGIVNGRVADIGTGAGFPGIPIRMVRQAVQLTLVEAVAKKVAFLGEVLRKINISGVHIIRCRMEDISDAGFDLITARALGKYNDLLRWSKARLSQTGKIVLLLGRAEAEYLSQNAEWVWNEPKIVPDTSARVVLIGSPRQNS